MTRTDIAIYLPSMQAGGAQRVMMIIANGLANRDYSVELVVGNTQGGFKDDLSDAVKLMDLNAPDIPGISAVGALVPFYKYLSREDPRVVISSMNHVNVVLLLAWKLAQTTSRMVVTEHNDPKALQQSSIKNRMIYRIASFEYPWADRLVAVSDGVAENLSEILDIPRDQVWRIYNPVVSDELIRKSSQHADHQWFDRESPVILNIGRLSEQKNQALLLRAFSRVRDRLDAKLIIVGNGKKEKTLRRLAEDLGVDDHVEIINWVDNPYAYMSSADIFVLSSKWEGLPTVLIEALACGCPVVSTDCPSGPREILADGEYGRLVEVRASEALAEAIDEELHDPTDREKLKQRGEDFSVDRCIENYDELIERLLRNR